MSILGSPMGLSFEKQVKFTFSSCLIKSPLIYEMSQIYDIVINIKSADINEVNGWVIMGVSGTGDEMDKAFQWMADQGVGVQMMFPNFGQRQCCYPLNQTKHVHTVPKAAPPAYAV